MRYLDATSYLPVMSVREIESNGKYNVGYAYHVFALTFVIPRVTNGRTVRLCHGVVGR